MRATTSRRFPRRRRPKKKYFWTGFRYESQPILNRTGAEGANNRQTLFQLVSVADLALNFDVLLERVVFDFALFNFTASTAIVALQMYVVPSTQQEGVPVDFAAPSWPDQDVFQKRYVMWQRQFYLEPNCMICTGSTAITTVANVQTINSGMQYDLNVKRRMRADDILVLAGSYEGATPDDVAMEFLSFRVLLSAGRRS